MICEEINKEEIQNTVHVIDHNLEKIWVQSELLENFIYLKDFFNLIFSEYLIQNIIEFTNKYA